MGRRSQHIMRAVGAGLGAALRLARPISAPLEVWIEPTDACPGGCALCPHGKGVRYLLPERPGGCLAQKVPDTFSGFGRLMADAIFGRALEAIRRWRPLVNLHHRGEPFLHPRIVEMIRAVAETGARVTLHTGAHVPLPAPAAALLSAGLSELVISLGAATPERFADLRPGASRDTVVDRARDLLAAGQEASTHTVVELLDVGETEREMETAAALFRTTPPDEIRLRPVHNWAGTTGAAEGPVRSRCLFPFYALVVLSDGRVTACPQDFEARLVVGDLNEMTLAEVWHGGRLRELRRRSRRDLAAQAPCATCSLIHSRGVFGFPVRRIVRFGRRKVLSR